MNELQLFKILEDGNIGLFRMEASRDTENNICFKGSKIFNRIISYSEDTEKITLDDFLKIVHEDNRYKVEDKLLDSFNNKSKLSVYFKTVYPINKLLHIFGSFYNDESGYYILGAAKEMDNNFNINQSFEIFDKNNIYFLNITNNLITYVSTFSETKLDVKVGDSPENIFEDKILYMELIEKCKKSGSVNWYRTNVVLKGRTKKMFVNFLYKKVKNEENVIIWLVEIEEIQRNEEYMTAAFHEIRTPVNAILGMIHLLYKTNLDKSQEEYLKKTKLAAKTLLIITNNILDFSKMEAGKLNIEQVKFSLKSSLDEVKDLIHSQLISKKLEFKLDIDDNIDDYLIGDCLKLKQILINLMSNAVKFTKEGHIILRVKKENTVSNEITLLFEVEDTGVGISAEEINNLFTPYTQLNNSVQKIYDGTGLGLAISKKLVTLLGGTIWCESKPEIGTVFKFTSKFYLQNKDEQTDSYSKNENAFLNINDYVLPDYLKGKKILLAEDDEINQTLTEKILSIEGFKVDVVSNGKEAVKLTCKNDYDFILMDLLMPKMNGITAAKKIRKNKKYKDVPIIALTATALEEGKKESLESGMNDYILKPIDPFEIYKCIEKWIRSE